MSDKRVLLLSIHKPIESHWANDLLVWGRIFKSTQQLCKSIPIQAGGNLILISTKAPLH